MIRLFPRLTGIPGPAVLTALILKDTHGKGPASEFSVMARGQVGVLRLQCFLNLSTCMAGCMSMTLCQLWLQQAW